MLVASFLLLLSSPLTATGQNLFLEGGPPRLQVDRFTPGSSTTSVIDRSTTLVYALSGSDHAGPLKIAVTTSTSDHQFTLEVTAQNVSHGTPQGAIRLQDGMPPTALIRDITTCESGSGDDTNGCEEQADLQYRLVTNVAEGPGRVHHVVQYTLLAQ